MVRRLFLTVLLSLLVSLCGFLLLSLVLNTAVSAMPTRPNTNPYVPWLCGQWFLSGVNVPWQNGGYGTDFGTVEEWGNYHAYSAADTADMFATLHASGVNTVRWWIFTDGRGAPEFNSASGGAVTRLDANFLPSLESAISLAQQYDIYLIFALWDFGMLDNENIAQGEHAGGHHDLIVEASKRQSFINNALLPMLQHPIAGTPYTVGTHPNVLGWDVINEPEWGISESGAVDPDISQPVTLAQMQRFVAEIAAAVHQNSSQLVTVGSASIKWNSDTALGATANWWADADLTPFATDGYLDFYQPHYYGWMNGDETIWSYSPLFNSTAAAGFDKPAVIGELPANALDLGPSLAGVFDGLYANGYAGFWTWAYEDDGSGGVFGTWPDSATAVTAFNQAHTAETAIHCAGDVVIYDDALAAGWEDWSWDSSVNLANGAPVHSGAASAAVTYNAAWAGFSLRTAAPLNGSDYDAISFWVYGSPGGNSLQLLTQPTDNGPSSPAYFFTATANTWTAVTIPLTALGSPTAIARITIQDASGAAQPTFYLDDIRLVAAEEPPTGLPDDTADHVLGQPDFTSSGSGTTASQFNGPAGVAVAPDGRLFVVDYENHRILSWPDAATFPNGAAADLVLGQPNFTSSTPGSDDNSLNHPESIAVDLDGNLFVADTDNHRLMVFSPPFSNGMNATLSFGQFNPNPNCQNPTPTTFCFPRGLATDGQGALYLVDEFHGRVLIYDPPLTHDTLPDLTISGLADPRGIAVDGAGNVYVTDSENDRVLEYDTPRTTDSNYDRVFGTGPDGFDCFGENDGAPVNAATLACPVDLAVDGSGNLYISDLYNHRVLVYVAPLTDNMPDALFGQNGSFTSGSANHGGLSATSLFTPLGLTVDGAGNLYLADFGNNRLLVYEAPFPPILPYATYLPFMVR